MHLIDVSSHGIAMSITQGWKTAVSIVFAAIVILLVPQTTQAQPSVPAKITQLEFVQWLVQLTGDSAQIPQGATSDDFINWAKSHGINPRGGWQPNAVLTKAALSEALVQLFNLNPKKFGGNLEKNLLREGIVLPDADEITRLDLMGVIDDFGFQSRTDLIVAVNTKSPVKRSEGGIPNGFKNPKNPFFGKPIDELPGAQGISNAQTRGNRR